MKTQVIQLDTHDDLVSVRDKMAWAKAPRLLLIWPHRAQVAIRPLDLTLLQRHAAALGAQLGLVTRSPEIRRAAQELGIPAFNLAAEAQRADWQALPPPKPRRRAPRPDLRKQAAEIRAPEPAWVSRPAARLGFFAAGVLAVLAVVLLFIPSAEITLNLETQKQEITIPVSTSADVQTVNLSGSIPEERTTVIVASSKTIPATGQASVPDMPARGVLRFRNLTDAAVTIPAGTVVRTTGDRVVRFTTLQDGEVMAGISNTVEIPAQALTPGTIGNLPVDALQAIEGSLGLRLAVTNPVLTFGGTDRTMTVPSADDRARLRAVLETELRRRALEGLAAQLTPGDMVFTDTLVLWQTLVETYTPAADQPGNALTLSLQLEYQAYYASADDLNTLAQAVLNAGLTGELVPVAGTFSIEPATDPMTTDGVTRWEMRASRDLKPAISPINIIRAVQGLSPEKARQRLEASLPLASPPQIHLVPSWWPWLPFLPLRIALIY